MKLSNPILFAIPTIIWGSTFFVITFQVGQVEPIWSVCYRFTLAGLFLLGYCGIKGIDLSFSAVAHLRIALQGALLFGFNYWLVYLSEQVLTSALVAVAFSGIIFLNIFFGTLILKRRTEKKVYLGALIGVLGTALLFYQDLKGLSIDELPVTSLILCFGAVVVASLGNITSAVNQQSGIPVIQANAFGMLYGGLLMMGVGFVTGTPIGFEQSGTYIGSLLYLTLFGSIIAFGGYLTLVGKIGPDKAAYVLIVLPVIALSLSSIFESFDFNLQVVAGMASILLGNYIVLKK